MNADLKPFAAILGMEPFDWLSFLNKPGHSEQELTEATALASSWVTCACGNLCEAIPRRLDRAPRDEELRLAGLNFGALIRIMRDNQSAGRDYNSARKQALHVLSKIEARSTHLLSTL